MASDGKHPRGGVVATKIQPLSHPVKKALLFAFHFPPSNETGARRPYRFVRFLAEYGYRVRVITAAPQDSAVWAEAYQAAAQPVEGQRRLLDWVATGVQRVLPYNDQIPWLPQATLVASRLIRQERPDLLISTSPPVACHLAGLITSVRFGVPWVADFRDPIRGNPGRSRRWGDPWDAVVERAIISRARAVVSNTDSSALALIQRYPWIADKVHVLWNGYDPDRALKPRPLPGGSRRIMLHAGSVYLQRDPTFLLESVYRLIHSGRLKPQDFCLRFVGDIDLSASWVRESRFEELRRLGCVEHLREVPQEAAEREITGAHQLLLLDLKEGLQVPGKLFEYIQIGRPVLAVSRAESPVDRILMKSGVPYCRISEDLEAEELDRRVLEIIGLPSVPVPPSDWFRTEFDGRQQVRKLAGILDKVLT